MLESRKANELEAIIKNNKWENGKQIEGKYS